MTILRKFFSFIYFFILIFFGITFFIFRTIDIWTGFSISGKFLNPVIDFLFVKFPTITTIFSILLILSYIVFYSAKLDSKKDSLERNHKIENDGTDIN